MRNVPWILNNTINLFIFETPEIEDKKRSHLQKLQTQQKTKPESGREISWSGMGMVAEITLKQTTQSVLKRIYKQRSLSATKICFFYLIYFPHVSKSGISCPNCPLDFRQPTTATPTNPCRRTWQQRSPSSPESPRGGWLES